MTDNQFKKGDYVSFSQVFYTGPRRMAIRRFTGWVTKIQDGWADVETDPHSYIRYSPLIQLRKLSP